MLVSPTLLLRWLAFAAVIVIALWLRTHDLAARPMHADEANQAVKAGALLGKGSYAFDPRDHHGPTLYYAALPIAWLRGQNTLAELDETTVRLVPAIFGIVSVALLIALASSLTVSRRHGRSVTPAPVNGAILPTWLSLAAAGFLAVSPPAVYYSRYFIQETLLVTFTLAAVLCARAWWSSRRLRWAVAFGVSAGLMQATKATAPLFLGAAAVACLAAVFLSRSHERERVDTSAPTSPSLSGPPRPRPLITVPAVVAILAFLLTTALFYSSFGTNLAGLRDALIAYTHALTRFGAEAAPTGHEKPWWYYVHLFGWFRSGGLVWHQLGFSSLALLGLLLALRPGTAAAHGRLSFLRATALYTVVIIVAFSFFPYKTPWHAVHFVPGLAILAAHALAAFASLRVGPPLAVVIAGIALFTQHQQTQRVAFQRAAEQRNPYAYVHTSSDILKYRALAEAAIAHAPDQPIRVISEEYWPLPWYFRGLPQVGYYAAPPADCDGALVVASATQAEAVRARLTGNYSESFLGLRPGFVCVLFTMKEGSEGLRD